MKTSKSVNPHSDKPIRALADTQAQTTQTRVADTFALNTAALDVFTFQAWVKTQEGGLVFQYCCETNNTGFRVTINALGHIETRVNSQLLHIDTISTLGGINDDYWHLLSITYQYHEIKCFIDGNEIHLQQQPTPLTEETKLKPLMDNFVAFNGELLNISLIEQCLSESEILDCYLNPHNQSKLIDCNLNIYPKKQSKTNTSLTSYHSTRQEVMLIIFNDTEYEFSKQSLNTNNFNKQLSNIIPAHERCAYMIESSSDNWPHFIYKANYRAEDRADIELSFDILKSLTPNRSHINLQLSNELEFDCFISQSTSSRLTAEIRISENVVTRQAKHFMRFINEVRSHIASKYIITDGQYYAEQDFWVSTGQQMLAYENACQLFNRRLQKKPLAIIKCRSSQEVKLVYKTAVDYHLAISVRSSGHDHEGESGETNSVVIDLELMNGIELDPISGIVAVEPGCTMQTLTSYLAQKGLMLPHSTSASHALAGFIMGGGWGPWCRKYGMCCESLVQAEIVLGIGETQVVSAANKPELLWALKGGGGLSYGIVTRFFIRTFALPPSLLKFELEWNPHLKDNQQLQANTPTLSLLERWEQVILADNLPCLLGTNLKIQAKPAGLPEVKPSLSTGEQDPQEAKHNCIMYGYWEGNPASLAHFIKTQFSAVGLKPNRVQIASMGGLTQSYGDELMESWNREAIQDLQPALNHRMTELINDTDIQLYKNQRQHSQDLLRPAPHRVTSRLAHTQGLKQGHISLIDSLTSSQLIDGNRQLGLFTYVTLSAISGDFYRTLGEVQKSQSAFPYKEQAYIIQYQAWWNSELQEQALMQVNSVYPRVNKALDWIDTCRDATIANSSGAFINFKDNTIPTARYFGQNYQMLQQVKASYCQDPLNHFRSRKSIV
ncbi:FAD-binding protein [Shewanella sp. HN-41]|uniref:FAD-binding protein n=1 Tax=Shewanella sp. HN-41 TaxID=327275 RepID=UPI0002125B45|nr:FAD-binding protein [Shewanella sp. HN-41]EGM70669.1 putative oxidoreductase, oxygen dependent, FAD-dependent protein [Shewanella sp. HN-41]